MLDGGYNSCRQGDGPQVKREKLGERMIRAIIENGQIRPLDPLPAEWNDGREVIVEDAESTTAEELEAWYRELKRMGPAEYEPGEWQHMQEVLNEADQQAKALVRREMGLS
jgi:hypothetical protein